MGSSIHKACASRTKATAPARPAAPAVPSSNALDLAVSRALDQEFEWYFAYAEKALARDSVGLLPSYAAARVVSSHPTDDMLLGKARDLARTVQGCLRALGGRHASVLRAAYTPRRWPKNVEAEFDVLAPIVVRLAVARDPWPARSPHAGLEDAAAARQSARLITGKQRHLAPLKARAKQLFGDAVLAYLNVRVLEGPAISLS
jgi:hypothetical protein